MSANVDCNSAGCKVLGYCEVILMLPHARGKRSLLSPVETLVDPRAARCVGKNSHKTRGLTMPGFSEAAWDSRAGNGERSARRGSVLAFCAAVMPV